MKNKFLSVCLGLTMVLLAAGFFIRSVSVSNAAPTPEAFFQQGTNKIGKYQMQYQAFAKGDFIHNRILVWDTETGKSKLYNDLKDSFLPDAKLQLPDSPMGN